MAASSQLRTSLHDGQAVSVRVLSRQLRLPLADARACVRRWPCVSGAAC
jgi:hypothetical protein